MGSWRHGVMDWARLRRKESGNRLGGGGRLQPLPCRRLSRCPSFKPRSRPRSRPPLETAGRCHLRPWVPLNTCQVAWPEISQTRTNHYAPLVQAIIDGKREQSTWTKSSLHIAPDSSSDTSAWSDDEEEGIPTPESGPEGDAPDNANLDDDELITESKDLHLLVNESITSLLRLSVQVHSSSRKGQICQILD